MTRKTIFVLDEYYHVFSRTILNIPEFRNYEHANRLIKTFLLANSTNSTNAFNYLRDCRNPAFEEALKIARKGKKLVDILCYAVMSDHYHFLLKELKEKGITEFIRKSNISISKYINIKNSRKGPLFESRFKSKHVDSNEYLLHLSLYIHLNPLDIIQGKEWREHGLKDWENAKRNLLDYPWSSLRHFLSKEAVDPMISGEEIILDQFNSKGDYEKFLKNWSLEDLEEIKNIII
jgi:putative transposase